MNTDRYTKIVLTLIALGLWITIIRPLVQPEPAHAQTRKQYGIYSTVHFKESRDMATILWPIDKNPENTAYVTQSIWGSEVVKALQDASRRGFKILSITPSGTGSFSIIVEK